MLIMQMSTINMHLSTVQTC